MPDRPTHDAERRAVVRDCIGLGLAVGSYGISFGAVAVAAGLSPLQACVLSLAAFTGGSQLAYAGVIGSGGSIASAVTTALLLGSRNTLYGVRLAQLLALRGPRRLLAAQVVIDETTAMVVAQPADRPELGRLAFWATAAAVYTCWNTATASGALAGSALGNPQTLGLDAAIPAAFLALLWPRLRTAVNREVALVGVLLAGVAVVVLPVGLAVPLAALAVLVAPGVGPRRPRPGAEQVPE